MKECIPWRLGFIFERRRWLVSSFLLIAFLLPSPAVRAGQGAGDSNTAPADSSGSPQLEFHLSQNVSIGFGVFSGDRDVFAKHEGRAVPSLNPDIELEGRARLRFQSGDDWRLRLDLFLGGKGTTTFGIGWRRWDAELGMHSFGFGRTGFDYVRSGEGVRVRRLDDGGFGLDVAALRSTTRRAEIVLHGDDSFGPFFLGHKRVLRESETVWDGGRRLQPGQGAGDGDYFIDYDGGFLYLHRVLLAHETLRVTYEYETDGGSGADEFIGFTADYRWGGTALAAFGMREFVPDSKGADESSHAYGVHFESTTGGGARWTNRVVFTNLSSAAVKSPVAGGGPGGETSVQGVRTEHRVEFAGERWHTVTSVAWLGDEFVDPTSRRPAPDRWALATENRYELRDDWAVLLRGAASERWAGQGGATAGAVVAPAPGAVVAPALGASLAPTPGASLAPTPGASLAPTPGAASGRKLTTSSVVGVGIEYRRQGFEGRLLAGQQSEFERSPAVASSNLSPAAATGGAGPPDSSLAGEPSQEGFRISSNFLQGELQWRAGAAAVEADFRQRLDAYRGGLPERMRASVTGMAFRLPVAVSYIRGDEHFRDNVEIRIAAPVQRGRARGVLAWASRWLYADGFDDPPRVVHTLSGDVGYDWPTGAYIQTRGSAAVISAPPSGSETFGNRSTVYDAVFNVGRPLGESGLIDYALHVTGRGTGAGPSGSLSSRQEARTASHSVTVAGTLPGEIGATLLWRRSEGRRSLPGSAASFETPSFAGGLGSVDAGWAFTIEQGWNVSLRRVFGPVRVTLSYATSATETMDGTDGGTGGAPLRPSEGGSARTSVEQTTLTFAWEGGPLSLQGNVQFELHDGIRRRRKLEFLPSYDVSAGTRLWLAYEFIASDGSGESIDGYTAHTARLGLTVRF